MIEVEFTTRITLEKDGDSPDDYSQYFITTDGRIFDTAEDEEETNIGTLSAVLVDADRAAQAGLDLWVTADACAGDMEALTSTFYEHGRIAPKVLEVLDASLPNLLYIRHIEIAPEHRGKRIGLAAIRRAIDILVVNCDVVALKPFPLQFEGKVTPTTNRKEAQAATTKLKRYYRQMGFKDLKGTGFMMLDLTRRLKDVLLNPDPWMDDEELD
jgi:GNAT superfamily N-acetyltransferase